MDVDLPRLGTDHRSVQQWVCRSYPWARDTCCLLLSVPFSMGQYYDHSFAKNEFPVNPILVHFALNSSMASTPGHKRLGLPYLPFSVPSLSAVLLLDIYSTDSEGDPRTHGYGPNVIPSPLTDRDSGQRRAPRRASIRQVQYPRR
jgi:hypothetical protein